MIKKGIEKDETENVKEAASTENQSREKKKRVENEKEMQEKNEKK